MRITKCECKMGIMKAGNVNNGFSILNRLNNCTKSASIAAQLLS